MGMNIEPYFKAYEDILKMADAAFARVKAQYPACVKCKVGCVDCCYALFDLTLIEALYLNYHFNKRIAGENRDRVLERSNRADREVYRIKRKAYRDVRAGQNESDVLTDLATKRLMCPLLNDQDRCDLYEYRPVTCRVYGVPTSIKGRGHTCGLSGFAAGDRYPSVNMDGLRQRLFSLSQDLVAGIKSKHVKMSEMLVPVSMALLTDYDESYLGIAEEKENRQTVEDAEK